MIGKAEEENTLTIPQLKGLASRIRDNRSDVCIRLRLIGKMWDVEFSHIVGITSTFLIVQGESSKKVQLIMFDNLIQFELDHNFQEYKAHNHYTLKFS